MLRGRISRLCIGLLGGLVGGKFDLVVFGWEMRPRNGNWESTSKREEAGQEWTSHPESQGPLSVFRVMLTSPPQQNAPPPPHQRRQQRRRRHRALRHRSILPKPQRRRHRQRRRLHPLRRLCYDSAERASVVKAGYAGADGCHGRVTEGIAMSIVEKMSSLFWT